MRPIAKAIVYMKIGSRSGETLDAIIARKLKEEKTAGFTFWGYGGTICHPLTVIRPFAFRCASVGLAVRVLMSSTKSEFLGRPAFATEYTTDRVNWQHLPRGIRTGSPYALVMRNLTPCKAQLDLSHYLVGYGPQENRRLTEYLRFRVDKAVALWARPPAKLTPQLVPVSYCAELVDPYAVVLR